MTWRQSHQDILATEEFKLGVELAIITRVRWDVEKVAIHA